MPRRIQLRRGTAAEWTAADPILAAGEIGVEIDGESRRMKIGPGRWSELDYSGADLTGRAPTEWIASTVSQAEAEAGTATTRRAWTAERVRQAIAAWWQGATSSFGRSLVGAVDAAAGRTALGLGTAATLDAGAAGGVAPLDGTGKVAAAYLPSSAATGGSSGQAQFNSSGSFAGAAGLIIDPATGRLTLAGFLAGSAPSAPSSGFTLFANASHALSWIGQNGYIRTFDGTSNTADRTYTLPNLSGTVALTSGAQTFTGKTLGNLAESTFTITDDASVDLNPANGPLQKWVLGTNRSPTATNFVNGQSMKLKIGGNYVITYPSVVWVGTVNGSNGSPPNAPTSGFLHVELWKEDNVLYGAFVGYTAT